MERYAQALVDLVVEGKKEKVVLEELKVFSSFLKETEELSLVLLRKSFSVLEKKELLTALFSKLKFSMLTQSFLMHLISKNRVEAFFEFLEDFEAKLNELEKRLQMEVFSATELSPKFKKELQEKFEKEEQRKLEIHYQVDPALLGGVMAKIGNKVFDGSLRTQLSNLGKKLVEGGI